MRIREYRPEDAEFLYALSEQEFSRYGSKYGALMVRHIGRIGTVALIAEDEARAPAGFCVMEWEKRHGYVAALAVHRDARRKGAARALLEAAIENGVVRNHGGPVELWLHVSENNHDGLQFFEAFGFQRQPGTTFRYENGDTSLIMTKLVSTEENRPSASSSSPGESPHGRQENY